MKFNPLLLTVLVNSYLFLLDDIVHPVPGGNERYYDFYGAPQMPRRMLASLALKF